METASERGNEMYDFAAMNFTEHVAYLKAMASLRPGDRVVTVGGAVGTVVKRVSAHNGWRVRWDNPVFGVTEGNVTAANKLVDMFPGSGAVTQAWEKWSSQLSLLADPA